MIPATTLAGYAVLAATAGGWLLRRAGWPQRAPGLGIAAWQALSASAVLAVILAGLVLAVPPSALGAGLAELLEACVWTLRAQYGPVGGPLVGAAGAAVAAAMSARTGYCLVRELASAARARRRHLALLAAVAHPHPRLPAVVVPHQSAAAYCLPGGDHPVVLTTGALAALDPDQLGYVLAHERAHLRWRHHLPVITARALHRTFRRVPTFSYATAQIPALVEMFADDAATRHGDRRRYAHALVVLAEAATPTPALAAGGPGALARVRRLLSPHRPLGPLARAATSLSIVVLLALPVVVAIAPALVAAQTPYCPVDVISST